jgi:hypothetical protein
MKKPLFVLFIPILLCLAVVCCSLPGHDDGGPTPTPTPTPEPGGGQLEFSHEGGVYFAVFDLTIQDPQGRPVYFTLNGLDPTIPFWQQLYDAPITISGNRTVKAAALNQDGSYSDVRTEAYQIDGNAGQPAVSPESDRFAGDQEINLTEDANTEVHYTFTTDGSEPPVPTKERALFTGPLSLTAQAGEEVTYRYAFKAFTTAMDPARSAVESEVLKRTWIIDKQPPEAPSAIEAKLNGDRRMHLTWTASVSPDTAQYQVYYGKGSSAENAVTLATTVPVTSADIPGLAADTRYAFSVFAVDSVGNRSQSGPYTSRIALKGLDHPMDEQVLTAWSRTTQSVMAGGYLYTSTYNGRVLVSDLTDRNHPLKLKSFSVGNEADSLAVSGGFLYVIADDHLNVYSLADPRNPSLYYTACEAAPLDGFFAKTQIGDTAFAITHKDESIGVYSLARAGSPPQLLYTFKSQEYQRVLVSGTSLVIYSARAGNNTVSLYNIDNPAAPQFTASAALKGPLMAFKGEYVYLEESNAFRVYNIHDPSNAVFTLTGNCESYNFTTFNKDYLFVVNNPFGAYPSSTAVSIYSLADPSKPQRIGTWTNLFPYCFALGYPVISLEGDTLLAFEEDEAGAYIMDVSDKAHPRFTCPFTITGEYMARTVAGNLLFLCGSFGRDFVFIDICDISDRRNPRYVGHFSDLKYTFCPYDDYYSPAVSGSYIYAAAGDSIFIGRLNGTAITKCGYYEASTPFDEVEKVSVRGRYLFAADSRGVRVFDISSPESPVPVREFLPDGGSDNSPIYMAVEGNYLMFADKGKHIYVYDISDMGAPVRQAAITLPGYNDSLRDLRYRDGRLYMFCYANSDERLDTYDISVPGSPVMLHSTLVSDTYLDTFTDLGDFIHDNSSNYGYILVYTHLLVLDFQEPESPYVFDSVDLNTRHTKAGGAILGDVVYNGRSENTGLFFDF